MAEQSIIGRSNHCRSVRREARAAVGVLILTMLTGCVSQDQIDAQQAVSEYDMGEYARARALLQPLAKKTNEDFALNNCRLGSTTLAMYDLESSQAAFLQAYEVFNSFGVNNGGRTLGAVLVDEKIKVWRGEPFERAMGNFYLGLTYYMQHDYNNARGAFENALFKLRDYQPDGKDVSPDNFNDVDSNFALAQYMLARCYQRLGRDDLSRASFKRLVDLAPNLATLADLNLNQKSNVLLVIDYADGPRKITNDDGAFVGFWPNPEQVGPPPRPVVYMGGLAANVQELNYPLVDLLALAQDHRWQNIDTVRAVKSILGTGLIVGGVFESLTAQHSGNAAVGLGLIAAGLLLKAASQADTRMWETLPRSTYAIPLILPPGKHDLTVDFPGSGIRQTLQGIEVPTTGEATYYLRMRFDSAPISWPPETLTGWPMPAASRTSPKTAQSDIPAPP